MISLASEGADDTGIVVEPPAVVAEAPAILLLPTPQGFFESMRTPKGLGSVVAPAPPSAFVIASERRRTTGGGAVNGSPTQGCALPYPAAVVVVATVS
jgi:hypothetical protein